MKIGLTLSGLILFLTSYGQNDFFFNHYMFNPSYYNPAWVGVENQAFVAGHARAQWVGFETSFDGGGGAPASQMVSLVAPSEGKLSGFGVSISNDQVAIVNNLQARFSFAYAKDFRFGKLSIGVMPSVFSQSLDFGQFRSVAPEPGIPEGRESQVQPDLSAGLYFKSSRSYFIGFSAVNILEPAFDYGVQFSETMDLNNQVERNYLLSFGTELSPNRDLSIRPTTLIRSDFNSYTFELSGIAYYKDKMWGGLSFRRSESVTVLLGYAFLDNNQLKFGYAFDYVVNDREAKQPTSHEFYLRYDLPGFVLGGKKIIKTPRFPF